MTKDCQSFDPLLPAAANKFSIYFAPVASPKRKRADVLFGWCGCKGIRQ
jgi:hypothetical protein